MRKVVMVSSLQPYSNYSSFLCEEIIQASKHFDTDFWILSESDPRNLNLSYAERIIQVWSKSFFSVFQIIFSLRKNKLDVLHVQHEFNMYGGFLSAIFFPLILLFARFRKIKVIVTLHGVPSLNIIDQKFIQAFFKNTFLVHPAILKIFFKIIFFVMGRLSNSIIVHTNYLKKTLTKDYYVKESKINVISHGVKEIHLNISRQGNSYKYFLYFGYISKRKGLEHVLNGYFKYLENTLFPDKVSLILAGGVIQGQEFALEEIKKLLLENAANEYVKITGFLDKDKISEYFQNCSAVVVPAEFSISASGPLSICFGYGKCPFVSNVPNISSEIEDGINGVLVNNSKWEEAFKMYSMEPEKILNIEEGSKVKAKERSWKNIAEKHLHIYQNI